MGGRKSVIDTPAVELLGYIHAVMNDEEEAAEREKAKYYLQYLIQVFSAPSFGKEDPKFIEDRRNFLNMLKPGPQEDNNAAEKFGWDEEELQRLMALEKGVVIDGD